MSSRTDVLDGEAFLARLEGDLALAKELLALFASHVPAQVDSLRDAIAAADCTAVEAAAHSLKGVLGNVHAERAARAAFELERMGRAGDVEAAPAAFTALKSEMHAVDLALAAFVKERLP